jgi:hypothetical protein
MVGNGYAAIIKSNVANQLSSLQWGVAYEDKKSLRKEYVQKD